MKLPGESTQIRIAVALERLVQLYERDLLAAGVGLEDLIDIQEVLYTDEEALRRREVEDEIRARLGLAPDQPIGVINPETGKEWEPERPEPSSSLFPGSWGFGVGPEGAEEAEPGAEEAWRPGGRTPGDAERPSGSEEPAGESGTDRSEGA